MPASRFFSNTESSLREDAIRFMKKKMRQEGWLLFNMHNNCKAISNRLFSLKYKKSFGVEEGEFIDFVKNEGFKLIQMWISSLLRSEIRILFLQALDFMLPFLCLYVRRLKCDTCEELKRVRLTEVGQNFGQTFDLITMQRT